MKRTALPRQEQRQQTRARLVEAALHVFAEQGYDRATVEEISLAAGYSKGAYYFHFDSKEDIFLELVSTWIEDQTARLSGRARRPIAAALLETLESLLRYDDRDSHWQLLLPEIWAQSHRNPRIRETLHAAYARWIALLEDAFQHAAGEGLVSLAVQPDVAASLVLAAHDGLTLRSRLTSATEGEPAPSEIVTALLGAIVAPSGPAALNLIPPTLKRTVRRKK